MIALILAPMAGIEYTVVYQLVVLIKLHVSSTKVGNYLA